jgi:hypothetical protein
MKARLFIVFVLVIGLALLLVWSAAAQGPVPGGHRPPAHPQGVGGVAAQGVSAAVALGSPGTVYRYVQTFGETEQAYPADVQHLYYPGGLFMDASNNLYVVEAMGARLLKYRTADGVNLLSIGTAGLQNRGEYTFDNPEDAAVDQDGHVWVVDNNRAAQYTTSGDFLQEFPPEDPWNSGSDNRHFDTPVGIAFDSAGRMYVSDLWNHRVQVYDFVDGSPVYSTTIGETGVPGSDDSHFNQPARITIDSSDRLYVTDIQNFRVQRCTYSAGWTCATFHGTGSPGSSSDELDGIWGVGLDSGDNVYLVDSYNGRVKKCTSGGSCSTFVSGLDGEMGDVAVDSSGNVYVSNTWNHVVRRYNSSGVFLGFFAGVNGVPYLTDDNHFNMPVGVAVDSGGNIYLTETRGYRLVKLSAAGVPQWVVGSAGVPGDDNFHFAGGSDGPYGVAADSSGRVYVVDTDNARIQIFNSNGAYLYTLGSSGNSGTGNDQFDQPEGVAIGPNGYIYVADTNNQRVQIFNSSRVYQATLGVTGVSGDDNGHFNYPRGVTVDSSGNIYVADGDNRRVQIFNSSRVYQRTLGTTGESGDDFDHFDWPHDVAVDAQGRIFVADAWNNRVQVFNSSGAYLTTIGGNWGAKAGELRGAMGVDVDSAGNVYVADERNSRIQKFAPGVPGWAQVNINGFGDRWAEWASALETFNGQLYAASGNWGSGARIWRTADGHTWTAVTEPGFGDAYAEANPVIPDMAVFGGQLYAGTGWGESGQVWRSSNGSDWQPVTTDGFGDSGNYSVSTFAAFGNKLYAGTGNDNGAQIWRSDSGSSGSWEQVAADGLGSSDANQVTAFAVFTGGLYAAIESTQGGAAQIWSTANGTDWTPIVTDGFGDDDNYQTGGMAVFDGYLYVGTRNDTTGGQLFRTANGTTWTPVMEDGFGDGNNAKVESLFAFADDLYAITANETTGMEVWRSPDGTTWDQIDPDGLGDSNNRDSLWSTAVVTFKNGLYIGTWNTANGGEVWQLVSNSSTYLPIVLKNR